MEMSYSRVGYLLQLHMIYEPNPPKLRISDLGISTDLYNCVLPAAVIPGKIGDTRLGPGPLSGGPHGKFPYRNRITSGPKISRPSFSSALVPSPSAASLMSSAGAT
jgi:hypothetical protein